MRTSARFVTTALAIAAALGLAVEAVAQAEDPEGYADGYQAGTYGRIRFADGGAVIERADGQRDDADRAGVNAPIFPGDAVVTANDARVEVQLSAGTLVRVDRGSELVFQSMPDPYAKYQDNVVLVLRSGAIRVTSRVAEKEEFRIDTEAGSVYLLGEGEYRVEADGRGVSVASFRGVAEVVGADGSILVRGGSRSYVATGSVPAVPQPFSALAADGFDRWCESRDGAYRSNERHDDRTVEASEVPSEVQPYYRELSSYGTWTVVPDYGRVWYPTGVSAGWRPYYDGYWSYGPGGYFWVSSEPWGWAPYRYGNWQWVGSYGWCWVPGNVFAGAWVSWSWGSLHVGWAPLDYWGSPCWRGGYRYYGGYDPDCWTFVNYSNIGVTNVRRYAVPVGSIGNELKSATIVARAPRVPPSRLAVSREARESAIRQAGSDRAAHIRPVVPGRAPERTLRDLTDRTVSGRVNSGLTRTPPPLNATPRVPPRSQRPMDVGTRTPRDLTGRAASGRVNSGFTRTPPSENTTPRVLPRRIVDDPRRQSSTTPDARNNVRDLYERVSRPRETRATPSRPAPAPPQARPQARPPERTMDRARSAPPKSSPTPRAQPRTGSPKRPSPQRSQPAPKPQRRGGRN